MDEASTISTVHGKNGANTLFTCWGDAFKQFVTFEKGRIYHLKIPGKCVKMNEEKYGVKGPFEVKMNQPCKMVVAKEAFPCEVQYNFQQFDNLNQMQEGDLVDIIGRVMSVGVDDPVKKPSLYSLRISIKKLPYCARMHRQSSRLEM